MSITQFVFLGRQGDAAGRPIADDAEAHAGGGGQAVHRPPHGERQSVRHHALSAAGADLRRRAGRCWPARRFREVDVEVVIEPNAGTAEPRFRRKSSSCIRMATRTVSSTSICSTSRCRRDRLRSCALRRLPNTERYGVVNVEAGRIVAFEPRGSGGEGVINGGVYLLRRWIVGQIGPGFQSLEQDVFPVHRRRATAPRINLRGRIHPYRRARRQRTR